MSQNHLLINVETLSEEVKLPRYATEGSSGADVRAHLQESLSIAPGAAALLPTGLRFEIPSGYEIQVRPRSGHALKHQITVLNTPGTIDSDYRGELKVILMNHGQKPFVVEPNMFIAQIVVAPVTVANFQLQEQVNVNTNRGEGGFGHTGKF